MAITQERLDEELVRLPGMGVLGYGYDATKYYANAKSVTYQIYDLGPFDSSITAANGKTYSVPSHIKDKVNFPDMANGHQETICCETAEDYRKSLSTKIGVSGSYAGFSASVNTHFEKKELASFNHTFVTLYHIYDFGILMLPDISTLDMLPSAKKDIDGESDLTPDEVIRKYGTHVVVSAIIGGRARYTCFVDRSKYQSEEELTLAVETSYNAGVGKLDASTEIKNKEAIEKFKKNSRIEFDTIGGTFVKDFSPTSFTNWVNSFTERPVLVDFTDRSLVEIFELASTEERRDELEEAFMHYFKESEKLVPDDIQLIKVEFVSVNSVDFIENDRGSGARMNLAVYKPKLPAGWYWVGQTANIDRQLVRIKPLVPGAVSEPLSYKCAWTDRGSGNDNGYSLWNISPEPGYRPLGGIARLRRGRTDWNQPSGEEVQGLACVHEDLCVEGTIGERIWNDGGSGANADGSVWQINSKYDGIDAKTFYCQNNHGRPGEKVFVIKRDANKVDVVNEQ